MEKVDDLNEGNLKENIVENKENIINGEEKKVEEAKEDQEGKENIQE